MPIRHNKAVAHVKPGRRKRKFRDGAGTFRRQRRRFIRVFNRAARFIRLGFGITEGAASPWFDEHEGTGD